MFPFRCVYIYHIPYTILDQRKTFSVWTKKKNISSVDGIVVFKEYGWNWTMSDDVYALFIQAAIHPIIWKSTQNNACSE